MSRCGYIALLGRPNVGKSTLLNALVGAKLAGVSDKAQTTRNKIVGLWTEGESQLVFLDTPGLHKSEGKPVLNRLMMKEAWRSAAEADICCFLLDGRTGVVEDDIKFLEGLLQRSKNDIYLLVSKSDLVKREHKKANLEAIREALKPLANDRLKELDGMYYSAKIPEDLQALKEFFAAKIPEGPWMYDEEQLTDRSQKFIVGEYIREQMFRQLGDELPYGAGVIVEKMELDKNPVVIMADIYVVRESQKRMVIGKGGQKIKTIGQNSRVQMEDLFGKKVFLELFVKVKAGWVDKLDLIEEITALSDSGD